MLGWADDFGRWGSTTADMLDGLYSEITVSGIRKWHLSTANPRTGADALRFGDGASGWISNAIVRRIFGSAKSSAGFGYPIYLSSLPGTEGRSGANGFWCLAQYRDAANAVQLTVALGTDGAVVAYTGGDFSTLWAGTLIGRSDPCITAGGWNFFEMFATVGASSDGNLEIRVNGVTVLNLTSVTTVATANHEFSQVAFGCSNGSGLILPNSVDTIDVADMAHWDNSGSYNNDFLGDNKAFLLIPTADLADTSYADWFLSTGSSYYALIDDIPPDDDSTYIYSLNAGEKVGVQCTDLPANASSIRGVVGWFRGKKTDAGTCNLQIGVLSGGVEAWSADIPLTTDNQYFEHVFEVDPATSAPWTPSAVNSAQLLYKRTA